MPQAIRFVWPMTTPGTPANVKPATANGHACDGVWQCRPIWYQMPGMLGARCGSLASSGLPVEVSRPDTTQELEPTPSAPPPRRFGTASSAACAASRPPCASAEPRAVSSSLGRAPRTSLPGRGAAAAIDGPADGPADGAAVDGPGDGPGDGAAGGAAEGVGVAAPAPPAASGMIGACRDAG